MDIKLDHLKIRQLRLANSWSQERLAEVSQLNTRTIQRVEADGTASLQTRLQLAKAFSVAPSMLDRPLPELEIPASREVAGFRTIPHLPILILLCVVYIAWAPLYFRLSAVAWSYNDYLQFFSVSTQWIVLLSAGWLVLTGIWLAVVGRSNPGRQQVHAAYLLAPLIAGTARIWLPVPLMHTLAWLLFISGCVFLLSFYRPARGKKLSAHVFGICLTTYIFIWCFHGTLYSFAFVAMETWQRGGEIHAPWVSFGTWLQRTLARVAYLLPFILIVMFALGRNHGEGAGTSGTPFMRINLKRLLTRFDAAPTTRAAD